ncbi:MAG: hypothetical protein AB7T49_20075 [Oligoflexales bacterium]
MKVLNGIALRWLRVLRLVELLSFFLLGAGHATALESRTRPKTYIKKKPENISSEKQLDHHHVHNSLNYNLGLSATKSFGDEASGTPHGEHDASGNADATKNGDSDKIDPMLMAMVSYRLVERFSVDLMAGTMLESRLMDPTLGLTMSLPVTQGVTSVSGSSLSAPVSEASQDAGKITTARISTGLLQSDQTLALFIAVDGSMSWYQEASDEEDGTGEPTGHEEHDHAAALLGQSLAPELLDTREFIRIGAFGGGYYDIYPKFRLTSDIRCARIESESGDETWETKLTVLDISYSTGGFMNMGLSSMPMGIAANATFGLVSFDSSPSTPSTPEITLGVSYGG